MSCDQPAATTNPIKNGDSFLLVCEYRQNNVATDVSPFAIRAQVRDSSDALVQELTVEKADQVAFPGKFALIAGVIAWPIDLLRCDIQFSEGQTVRSTQTFFIPVEESITHD